MSSAPNESIDASPLSRDTVFSILSNQRRRYALHYLERHPGPVRIDELAEQVAAWEYDIDVSEVSYRQRKRVYTSLYQSHLPKLDQTGVVEYDRDEGIVEAGPQAATLQAYLDDGADDAPWWTYYLGLSALVVLLLFLSQSGVYPFALVSDLAFGVLVTVAFALSAGVHAYYAYTSPGRTHASPPEPVRDD